MRRLAACTVAVLLSVPGTGAHAQPPAPARTTQEKAKAPVNQAAEKKPATEKPAAPQKKAKAPLTKAPAPPASSAATERRFADWLLARGDAYRAIGAYERYLFLAPGAPDGTLVRYRIALAYYLGDQLDAAANHALSITVGDPKVVNAARLLAARALFGSKRYAEATALLSGDTDPYALYLSGWSHLEAWEVPAAHDAFAHAGTKSGARLAKALRAPLDLPYRSPVVAGLLSIVPGLGHAYLGRWDIALSALLWNGAFGWGLYDTIRTKQWGLTALVGILESVWYFGTIYGAVVGAERFDRDAVLDRIDTLGARDPPPGLPPQPALPGAPPISISVGVPIP